MDKNSIKNLINKANPIIFEIGCADGIDTIDFLNTFGSDLTMYCFDPDNRNAQVFQFGGHRPLAPDVTYGINQSNIIFEQKAIGDIDGIIKFNQSSTIYSSSIKKSTNKLHETWPSIKFDNILVVESVKLDTYTEQKNINIIDFIWADVQGAEDLMIKGGKNTFKNKVRFLYTEYSPEYYENAPNKDEILELLGNNWIILQDFGSDLLLKNTYI
jgi:FkbM family methyltransferase